MVNTRLTIAERERSTTQQGTPATIACGLLEHEGLPGPGITLARSHTHARYCSLHGITQAR
jgi:hypothetical protein